MSTFFSRMWGECYGNRKKKTKDVQETGVNVDVVNVEPERKIWQVPPEPSKPITENDLRQTLASIYSLNELDYQNRRCPQHLEFLIGERLKDILADIDDLEELENADLMSFDNFHDIIVARYEKIFPKFLREASLEELEDRYEKCLDFSERFGELIKQRYRELLGEVDSFDDLEERRSNCPEDFNDFFRVPYQKLLNTVDSIDDLEGYFDSCPEEFDGFYFSVYEKLLGRIESVEELEGLYKNCRDTFDPLYAYHYRRLLERENSLEELENLLGDCSECFEGLVEARYENVLKSVTSIDELDRRYESCPEALNGMILAYCRELLPSVMRGIPSEEVEGFCNGMREEFKQLALTCRDLL